MDQTTIPITIQDEKIPPEKINEKLNQPWKVVNIEAGQKNPETVQAVLNDLESKKYCIVGCEPVSGGYIQIYAKSWNSIQHEQVYCRIKDSSIQIENMTKELILPKPKN